ncbi:MAG: methionyl-tRNA formyltransferase [Rhodospirillaceae bacterium]|nr:methionyl-tRNA formyltransferase [Rhodospirillaceae bacterium]
MKTELVAPLRLALVRQKWLGEKVLERCLSIGEVEVARVIAPSADDRLGVAAIRHRISLHLADRQVTPAHLPYNVDLIVCAHAHAYVTRPARQAARLGAIGYHPSLLPLYRGKDAIEQAIAAGQRVTGGTVYELDDGYDTGRELDQDWCFIRPDDTPTELWRRELGPMGLKLLGHRIRGLALRSYRASFSRREGVVS